MIPNSSIPPRPIFYVMQRASGAVKLGGIYRRASGDQCRAVEQRRREIERLLKGEKVIVLYAGTDLDEWVRAPKGRIDDELRAAIAARKGELLELVTTHPCSGCGRFRFHRPTTCFFCRSEWPASIPEGES